MDELSVTTVTWTNNWPITISTAQNGELNFIVFSVKIVHRDFAIKYAKGRFYI